MSKRKVTFFSVIIILVVVSLACNLGASPAAPTANPDESNPEEQPTEEIVGEAPNEADGETPTEMVDPAPSEQLTPTPILSSPIGLRQGLASLNSYRLKINIIADGPTPQDKNHNLIQVEYTSDGDKTYSHTESSIQFC